jgi:hypothetical protein
MNRSILIVICDFLLISLLAFSTVDVNKINDSNSEHALKFQQVTNQPDAGKDLSVVMRQALEEERKNRDQLMGELARARNTLTEREQQVQTTQQQLHSQEQQSQQLLQQQTALQQEFTAAQTNIQALSQQLHTSSTEALLSQEKLAAMQAEMLKKLEQSTNLQQQIEQLARSNQVVLSQKEQLAGQLQVAEAEKRTANDKAAFMAQQVQVEREEKAKLAEGVKALATHSSELTQEVRENRQLTPNTIFSEFLTNRVQANFEAFRSGLIDTHKRRNTDTIMVSDGTNTFALCHVQETPLSFWNPGTDWEGLTGNLNRGTASVPIHSLVFALRDPRVILLPVSKDEAKQLGGTVYRTSADPYKWQDAVLVGARESYYGECKFEIDPSTPGYVRLDRNVIKGLFGKFNPSKGDLVFSKTGELLGVMANGSYCMVLQSFDGAARLQFGSDVREQHTGGTLAQLYAMVSEMPYKLQ